MRERRRSASGCSAPGSSASSTPQGLRHVPAARPVAAYGRDRDRREAFAERNGYARTTDSIEAVCADPEVDLVIVSLPNHLHVEAVRAAARHGKGVAVHQAARRDRDEAAEMVRLATDGGVLARLPRERRLQRRDRCGCARWSRPAAIGTPVTFRAREAHSGPHAPHFWDAELAGGGALLDMASHGDRGRPLPLRQGRARPRGVRLGRHARPSRTGRPAEDNAVMLMRFDDGRAATMDVSWSSKGGLEGRFELAGDRRTDHLRHGVDARSGRSSSSRPGTSPRRRTPTPAGSSRCPTRRTSTGTTR